MNLLSFLATSLVQATTFSNLKCCNSLLLPLFHFLHCSPNKFFKCKYENSFLYWKPFKSFTVIRLKTNILTKNLHNLFQAKLSSFISTWLFHLVPVLATLATSSFPQVHCLLAHLRVFLYSIPSAWLLLYFIINCHLLTLVFSWTPGLG